MLILKNGRAACGRLVAVAITALMMFVNLEAVAATQALNADAQRSKLVRYDADVLDNPVEAQKLYRRLRLAAKSVCRRPSDETSNGRAANACQQAAMAQAVAGVNHVSLTAIHRARTGSNDAYRAWAMAPTPCAQCG